jgi:hypothetical protein
MSNADHASPVQEWTATLSVHGTDDIHLAYVFYDPPPGETRETTNCRVSTLAELQLAPLEAKAVAVLRGHHTPVLTQDAVDAYLRDHAN